MRVTYRMLLILIRCLPGRYTARWDFLRCPVQSHCMCLVSQLPEAATMKRNAAFLHEEELGPVFP